MNREFYQLMLTSRLGDGRLESNGRAIFSCIKEEYILFKKEIIESVFPDRVAKLCSNIGYKKDAQIYIVTTLTSDLGKDIYKMSLSEVINELDEFGMALWAYDDGSLHHKKFFYNLNSHALPENVQRDVLIPKLKSFGISGATIFKERKKDGREFSYINIPKLKGAYELDSIMRKIRLECYEYKLLPTEYQEAYRYFKELFAGKSMSQTTLSKLIKEKLEGGTLLLDRVKDHGGYINSSSYDLPRTKSDNYTIVL
jgi:hypothetical protein